MSKYTLILLAAIITSIGCKEKDPTEEAKSNVQFQVAFDTQQPRLNNIGQPATIPAGNAAQTPVFQSMSIHYIELSPTALTPLGKGAVVYLGTETTKGGENAVDFDKAAIVVTNQTFAKGTLPPGTYEWIRTSVTYQNYGIDFDLHTPTFGVFANTKGTVASFLGFNTYISTVIPSAQTLTVNSNKKQGFWAFEVDAPPSFPVSLPVFSGAAPEGATTVVNPLFATSPVPQGSCIVTGKLAKPLVVTGQETAPITITLSYSVNNSFEWKDNNGNGRLDIFSDPSIPTEKIVDMGLRGLVADYK